MRYANDKNEDSYRNSQKGLCTLIPEFLNSFSHHLYMNDNEEESYCKMSTIYKTMHML